MTPPVPTPGLIETIGGWVWIGVLVAINVWTRWRGSKKLALTIDTALAEKVAEIDKSIEGFRKSLADLKGSLEKFGERLEKTEKADDRLAREMHALGGRVDAANEKYTEILVALKARQMPQDPAVTGKVTFKEEKKK